MGKQKYVWVIVVLGALVSVVVFVKGFNKRRHNAHLTSEKANIAVGGAEEPKLSTEPNSAHSYVVEPESEYNRSVRGWITRERLGGVVDSRGINNCLSGRYTNSTPLIEIHCKQRDLDGQIGPLKVKGLYIVSDEGGGGGYQVGATGLRLELGQQQTDSGNLLFGTEYTIDGPLPDVKYVAATNFARTRKLKFRTPQSLKAGQIYIVELVLVDRILDKKQEEIRASEAKRRVELEQKERITIKVANLPRYSEQGRWILVYGMEGRIRESCDRDAEGNYFIKGPNKLGGELVLGFSSRERLTNRIWAYVKNVQKRQISLPADADLLISESNVIKVYLSFGDEVEEKLNDPYAIEFYLTKSSAIPLFVRRLLRDRKGAEGGQKAAPVEIAPGSYFVKTIDMEGKQFAIGQLEIGNEAGKAYTITLPTDAGL